MKLLLLLIFGAFMLQACAHKPTLDPQGYWNEESGKSVHLKVLTLLEKRTKIDLVALIENKYPFTVVIPENSMHFDKGGERALGNSNSHLILKPGEIAEVKFTLRYQSSGYPGPSTLTIEYIHQGEEALGSGVTTQIQGHGVGVGAAVGRGIAVGGSQSSAVSTSQGYVTKSAVEGKQLKAIVIQLP